MDLKSNIQYLKGVGPAKAALLQKLSIETVGDLLYHFPRDYIDLSVVTPISAIFGDNPVAVRATVLKKFAPARIRRGLTIFKALISDMSGDLTVTIFNNKYAFEGLKVGEEYLFYGRALGDSLGNPLIFKSSDIAPLMPVYPLTAGITSSAIRKSVKTALSALPTELPDPIPATIRERYSLMGFSDSLFNIHFPETPAAAAEARERMIFEEFFVLSLALSSLRFNERSVNPVKVPPFSPNSFYESLPYEPTGAQKRAVSEIAESMSGSRPMSRLLQGDVGSGKTLVAAAACLAAAGGGYQCAVMAPTEILANQHYETFSKFFAPFSLRLALLTGSMRAAARREVLLGLKNGEIDVAIGTHALLSEGVDFKSLGLVITDEQHRFGVRQRVALSNKREGGGIAAACDSRDVSENEAAPDVGGGAESAKVGGVSPDDGGVHVLVMSATPIPRTLALIIYGDLELSVLDEMPVGRQKIETFCIPFKKLPRAFNFIRGQLLEGRQAYIVCPLVTEEEALTEGLLAAEETARELSEGEFMGFRVGVLHGKQPPKKKDEIMSAFKSGELQLLIATTVVEVGVDVPNATVMLCMNAERFGLSQLHQLRGRVGRGQHQSYCILVSDARGETAKERLSAMCKTSDGFKLSEYDLKLRGPGDFFGGRQHGLPAMQLADLSKNSDTLNSAQEAAAAVLNNDPDLSRPKNRELFSRVKRLLRAVGERPN